VDGNVAVTNMTSAGTFDGTHRLLLQQGEDLQDPIIDMQLSKGLPCTGNNPGTPVSIREICKSSTISPVLSGTSTSSKAEDTLRYVSLNSENELTFLNDNVPAAQRTDVNAKALGYDWNIVYRRQIYWRPDCPITRNEIAGKESKIKQISTAQLILMILTIIASIYNYYATCKIFRESQDSDPTNDNVTSHSKKKINIITDIIVMVPTLAAIIIAYQNRDFFKQMKEYGCSDLTTNDTFHFLADKITSIAGLNIAKFVVSFIFLSYRIYSYRKEANELKATK
jgi:hypothetical protein